MRVDADVVDKLIQKDEVKETHLSEREQEELRTIFSCQLPTEGASYTVAFEAMGAESEPVVVTRSEFMRRMKEMSAMNPGMGFYGAMGDFYQLVVNSDHPIVKRIVDEEQKELGAKLEPIMFEIGEEEIGRASCRARVYVLV